MKKSVVFLLRVAGAGLFAVQSTASDGGGLGVQKEKTPFSVYQAAAPVKAQTPCSRVAIKLETGLPVRVWSFDNPQPPKLILRNDTETKTGVSLYYSLKYHDGTMLETAKKILYVPAGGTVEIPLPRPTRQGIYDLEYSWPERGVYQKLRFAAMKPTGQPDKNFSDGFLFGVCSQFRQPEDAEFMRLAGVQLVRVPAFWFRVQRKPGACDFEDPDRFIDLCARYNIEPKIPFGGAPRWARVKACGKEEKGLRRAEYKYYRDFVRQTVEHYRGKARFFSVWNEPDIPYFANFPYSEYLELQKIAWRELKASAPDAKLIAGGFAGPPRSDAVIALMAEKSPDTADVISMHMHNTIDRFPLVLDDFIRQLRTLGLKQDWLAGETGLGSSDEELMSETLFKKVILCWSEGAIGYCWYSLRNSGFDSGNLERRYGLIATDFNPRRPYVAYNTLTSLLRGARFIQRDRKKSDLAVFHFVNGDRRVIASWHTDFDYGKRLLKFKTAAVKADILDLYGNAAPLDLVNGEGLVTLPGSGAIICLRPADAEFEFVEDMAAPAEKCFVGAGENNLLKIKVRNPYADRPVRYRLAVRRTPDNLAVTPETSNGVLAAGECRVLALAADAAENFQLSGADDGKLLLEFQIEGRECAAYLVEMTLYSTVRLKENSEVFKKLKAVNSAEQASRMLPAVPENGELFWRGPRDCSAYAQVRAEPDRSLLFQIKVVDDVHQQTFSPAELWRGDSVQLILKFPDQNDCWDIGFAADNEGKVLRHIFHAPAGANLKKALDGLKVAAGREARRAWNFSVNLKPESFGADWKRSGSGIACNILINDNDGRERETQMSLTKVPGRGVVSLVNIPKGNDGVKDRGMENFPLLVIEP